MRGANCRFHQRTRTRPETSPHAWSKPSVLERIFPLSGNISTCVEQTFQPCMTCPFLQKHLHMRGANKLRLLKGDMSKETSPHAWSKQCGMILIKTSNRNISTCVEQTLQLFFKRLRREKHLHMRGANLVMFRFLVLVLETSPHAWSKLSRNGIVLI